MTEKQGDASPTELTETLDRRQFIAISGGVSATVLAGCSSDTPSTGDGESSSDDSSGDETTGDETNSDGSTDSTANFRLLISDRPADIDDFDSLNVSFSHARIFDGGSDDGEADETVEQEGEDADGEAGEGEDEGETEEETTEDSPGENDPEPDSDGGDEGDSEEADGEGDSEDGGENEEADGEGDNEDGEDEVEDEEGEDEEGEEESEQDEEEGEEESVERGRGFYRLDLEGRTVDLTRVVGDAAEPVFEGNLSPGTYQKIELHVSDVEGIVDGEQAEVKVPSNKLQITHPFEIAESGGIDFVFDINVVQRGNRNSYNLTPVISESGVAGEDVDVEEGGEGGDEETGESETDSEGDDGEDTSDSDRDSPEGEADSPAGNDTETTGDTPDDSAEEPTGGE